MMNLRFLPEFPTLNIRLGLLLLGSGYALWGCSQSTCSVNPRFPDEPIIALECKSGQLCYRGSCVEACNAALENLQSCGQDNDCPEAQPFCVREQCSGCPASDICIPVLDICQPVGSIPLPPEPLPPTGGRPPGPRDAGSLDSGLQRLNDAGVLPPVDDLPLTRAVFIDISVTEVFAGPDNAGDAISIRSFNVEGNPSGLVWRTDRNPPALEVAIQNDIDCELIRFDTPAVAATPVDFGLIRINDASGNDSPDAGVRPIAIDQEIVATWNATQESYDLVPASTTIQLSNFDTLDSTFLTITGEGVVGVTDRSWPTTESRLHVPFNLTPEPSTLALMGQTILLGPVPSQDLTLLFNRVGAGVVATERVVARIPGNNHEIVCSQVEGPNADNLIVIRAGLLEQFRTVENAPLSAEYPLILERSSAERFQVNPAPDQANETGLIVTARVRHSLQSRIRF